MSDGDWTLGALGVVMLSAAAAAWQVRRARQANRAHAHVCHAAATAQMQFQWLPPSEKELLLAEYNRAGFVFSDLVLSEEALRLFRKEIDAAVLRGRLGPSAWRRLLSRLKSSSRPAGAHTAHSATSALDLLATLVPKRIANEEIGDALEQIHAMVKARRPRWFITIKVSTTFFWVAVHTGLHYAERVAGIIGKATGGKGD